MFLGVRKFKLHKAWVFALIAVSLHSPRILAGDGHDGPSCPWAEIIHTPLPVEQMHFEEYGSRDKPTLVLLHGLESFSGTFRPVTARLAKDYHVIAVDFRGNGKTPAWGNNYSNSVLADDVYRLLKHLKIAEAHVLGHSLGGRVAVQFAASHPEMVKSLVIEDIDLFQRRKVSEKDKQELWELVNGIRRDFQDRQFESASELAHALSVYFGPKEAELMAYRWGRKNKDGTVQFLIQPDVSFLYATMSNAEDLAEPLSQIKAPILALRADPRIKALMTKPGIEHLKQHAPHAQVEVVAESTHAIHRSQPDPYGDLVTSFLKGGRVSPELQGRFAPEEASLSPVVDVNAIFSLKPKDTLTALRLLTAADLNGDQMGDLIRQSSEARNPFLIREMLRIAEESNQKRWTLPLTGLLKFMVDNNPHRYKELIPEARRIRNQLVYRHHIENHFPEFATRGAYFSRKEAAQNRLPKGAAMHVGLGDTAPKGNRSVILANSDGYWLSPDSYSVSPELVRLTANNAIHLAKKQNLKKLDILLTGAAPENPQTLRRQGYINRQLIEELRQSSLPVRLVVETEREKNLFVSLLGTESDIEVLTMGEQPGWVSEGAVWLNADKRRIKGVADAFRAYVGQDRYRAVVGVAKNQLSDFSERLLSFVTPPPRRQRGLGAVLETPTEEEQP